MSARPVRLRLSRSKGFDLQAVSRAFNGLPAVNCARPGKWGNPFVVAPFKEPGHEFKGAAWGYVAVPTVEDAVEIFRIMMTEPNAPRGAQMRAEIEELRGKNLACWCAPGAPCHADVLLEIANRPTTCDEVAS